MSQNSNFVRPEPCLPFFLSRRPTASQHAERPTDKHPNLRRARHTVSAAALRAVLHGLSVMHPPAPAPPVGSLMPLRSHAPSPLRPFWTPRPAPQFPARHASGILNHYLPCDTDSCNRSLLYRPPRAHANRQISEQGPITACAPARPHCSPALTFCVKTAFAQATQWRRVALGSARWPTRRTPRRRKPFGFSPHKGASTAWPWPTPTGHHGPQKWAVALRPCPKWSWVSGLGGE